MASYEYLNCSKAQMCLFKILRIISSIPPSENSKEEPCSSTNKGIGIDLNLRFCSAAESGESESSAVDQGNNNNKGGEEEAEAEALGEKSVEVESFKVENNGVGHVESESEEDREGNESCEGKGTETVSFPGKGHDGGDCNCLDLLIEAAKVLSAKDESNDSEEERGLSCELRTRRASQVSELLDLEGAVKKRKERWVVVDLYGGGGAEETPPVVRSKRGRNQALPYRFRDSVVEPLKRSGRPQRPSSTPHARKRLLGS